MTSRVVAILGPMRSGTSLVAAMVHRMGWPVAPTIPAPGPPTWRSDFEDPALTFPLLEGRRPTAEAFADYLTRRRLMSDATGFEGRVAVKSPLLALVWPAFVEGAGGADNVRAIRCYREAGAIQRSMAAHPQIEAALQARILAGLRQVAPFMELGYEWAVEHPERAARALADALGVRDETAILAAAALVGQPTRYGDADTHELRGGAVLGEGRS